MEESKAGTESVIAQLTPDEKDKTWDNIWRMHFSLRTNLSNKLEGIKRAIARMENLHEETRLALLKEDADLKRNCLLVYGSHDNNNGADSCTRCGYMAYSALAQAIEGFLDD